MVPFGSKSVSCSSLYKEETKFLNLEPVISKVVPKVYWFLFVYKEEKEIVLNLEI